MTKEQAENLCCAVEKAHERLVDASAYTACKAAGVPLAEYKVARIMVYGINDAV